jgi:Na+:H+ antiporter, NhaA family
VRLSSARRTRMVEGTAAFREFVATELAGGVVLLVATAVALAWANSPWKAGYHRLWNTELAVALGRWQLDLDLRHWVNDGLMAVFFLVVGIEIKRELLQGELRDRRRAALPVAAALGGMLLPAVLYGAINLGSGGAAGWGIPMATDIAFALGVLAVVAPRAPSTLRLFLLTLAIVDDIGAILVIAVFYSDGVEIAWLLVAVGALLVVFATRQLGVTFTPAFVAFGAVAWLGLQQGGVHPTLAGVAMGLLAPASPKLTREIVRSRTEELLDVSSPAAAKTTTRIAREAVSQLEWLGHGLHPWSSLLVVPAFALANAGISLDRHAIADGLTSMVAIGVVVGLVAGKTIGITGGAWLACRLGLADRPPELAWRSIIGVAALGGVGFTVSLLISELAFSEPLLLQHAQVGLLAATVLAVALGAIVLRPTSARSEASDGV